MVLGLESMAAGSAGQVMVGSATVVRPAFKISRTGFRRWRPGLWEVTSKLWWIIRSLLILPRSTTFEILIGLVAMQSMPAGSEGQVMVAYAAVARPFIKHMLQS